MGQQTRLRTPFQKPEGLDLPRQPLPKGDPNSPEELIMDFLAGLTGLPGMGDSQSKSGTVGELLGMLGPIAGVSVFAKGLRGGRLAADELKMMHQMQSKVSNEDLDEALKVLGLVGDVSKGQRNRIKGIADQFPRTMAHMIERKNIKTGEMNPRIGAYGDIRSELGGVGGIDPHPDFPGRATMGIQVGAKTDPVDTFAEELAHVGQGIGLKEHYAPLYKAVQQAGIPYERNPFEINAKITAKKLAPTVMDRFKDLFGVGPMNVKQRPLLQQLQELDIIPRNIPQGQIMEYLRKQGVPPGLTTDPWTNQLKAIRAPQLRSIMRDGS